jgi:proton-translocating NADH-quinone oxidoreductase chain L
VLFGAVLYPLVAAVLVLASGRQFSKTSVSIITVLCLCFSAFCSVLTAVDAYHYLNVSATKLFVCLDITGVTLNFAVHSDYLSVLMVNLVVLIALLVHIYSIEYMAEDPHFNRFMAYLSLFTFFMLMLVTSSELFQFFIGWEGVGLCSYLLVSFWFTRTQASISALKAFFINRVGDSIFLYGIFNILFFFNTLDLAPLTLITTISKSSSFMLFGSSCSLGEVLALSMVIGAMSKSAQIFLHTWLPDAMEGPTPVSALIHAATMVAAGVFLLARMSSVLLDTIEVMAILAVVGSLTAIFSASVGMFQVDIKKIVAYSTCSQLGFMVAAAGFGAFAVSVYHLTTHAFFKALLFLVSGSIIHSLNDIQDIRRYGGLISTLPYSYISLLLGSLALLGFPFLSGFYSKELIIEFSMLADHTNVVNFSCLVLTMTSVFTTMYSTKLIYFTFLANCNGLFKNIVSAKENGWAVLLALSVLCVFSVFFGWYANVLFSPGSGYLFSHTLIISQTTSNIDTDYMQYFFKNRVFISVLCTLCIAVLVNTSVPSRINTDSPSFGDNTISFKAIYFFSKKWYFDDIYNFFIAKNTLDFGYIILLKQLEFGFLEGIPYLVIQAAWTFGKYVEVFHTNSLGRYITYFFYSLLMFLIIQFHHNHFALVIVAISALTLATNYFFVLSVDNTKKAFISMYHSRRMILVRTNFVKSFILTHIVCLYILTFLFYTYNIYYIVQYVRYGLIWPAWVFKLVGI